MWDAKMQKLWILPYEAIQVLYRNAEGRVRYV